MKDNVDTIDSGVYLILKELSFEKSYSLVGYSGAQKIINGNGALLVNRGRCQIEGEYGKGGGVMGDDDHGPDCKCPLCREADARKVSDKNLGSELSDMGLS